MTELSTHVFELDLTSVCVSTGIVQLPMKMQPYFDDGAIDALIDGEDVRLEFSGPRRLGGFRSHFAKRGLKANDKVRFELEVTDEQVDEVSAACIKRERNKPVPASDQSRDDVSERTSDKAVGGSEDATEADKGASRDGSWGDNSSSVRAVRRVTIQGADTQPALHASPAAVPVSRAMASPASPSPNRARTATWRALDGLSSEAVPSDTEAAEFADTTVRAVRRRSFGSAEPATTARDSQPRTMVAAGDDHASRITVDEVAGVMAAGVEETSQVSLADLVVPTDGAQAPDPRVRVSPARARIFVGRGPRTDRETFGRADAKQSQSHPAPASATRGPELIEERELVPVAGAAAAGQTAESRAEIVSSEAIRPISNGRVEGRSADDWQGSVNEDRHNGRVAGLFDSKERRQANIAEHKVSGSSTVSGRRETPVVIDDDDFGGEYVAATEANGLPPELDIGQDSGAGQIDGTPLPNSDASSVGLVDGLEHDLDLIRELLERPNAPAIVRSDTVAEQLGLTPDRSERALERLSEERERISRIRKGAYMIRRDATKPSAG